MRHRFYKKVLSICLAVMMAVAAFLPSVPTYGASDDAIPDEGVVEVSDTSKVLTRGNFLDYGSVLMSKKSSTRVLITGITAAHVECDKLGVGLYLEQSSDGVNYGSYRQWYFWGENSILHTETLEVIVPSGYWYRLGGSHVALKGSDGESTTTMTNGIYVG